MDWHAYIDAYCERTAPGVWAEPLNAATNLAFWVAALCIVWHARKRHLTLPGDLTVLLAMLWAIGAGSLALHVLATRWAGALDVLAIALYLHFYLALYFRHALGLPWSLAWLGIPAFAAASFALAQVWRTLPAPGPSGYLAAWTVLLALTAHSAWKRLPGMTCLAAASCVFALSLAARQMVMPLCARWPWGTHFAWHVLNALTLGLTTQSLVLTWARQRGFRRTQPRER